MASEPLTGLDLTALTPKLPDYIKGLPNEIPVGMIQGLRELEPQDTDLIYALGPAATSACDIKNLKNRHQEIARRLTVGDTAAEISRDLGVSQSHISILVRNSTAFKELLQHFQDHRTASAVNFNAKREALTVDVMEAYHELFLNEEKKESLSPEFIQRCASDMMNRESTTSPIKRNDSRVTLLGLTADEIRSLHGGQEAEFLEAEVLSAEETSG